jgi:NADPH2:quinone reductase
MRAIVVRAFGGPEVLRLEDVPDPRPGDDDLLIEVVAVGVNPVDVSNHEDGDWAGITLPYTPGSDASGVVRAVGVNVTAFAVGDAVFSLTDFIGTSAGSYAELQVVPAALAVRKPQPLTHAEAASIPLAGGTAYEIVVRRLDVQPGERVVVYGASGGVGGFATQLAVGRGAQVVAVTSAASHDHVRALGASIVIDRAADVPERIASQVGEVDAVIDLVGGHTIEQSLPLLRMGGRAATIASLEGDLDLAIDRNITLHGVLLRPDGSRLAALAELVSRGELRTTIRGEHALADAAAAHGEVSRGGAPGKTVLRVRPEPA